jgi:hypothetical protein
LPPSHAAVCSVAFFCATYLLQSVLLARQYAYVVWVLPTYITDRRYYELNRVHFFADSDFHALPYVRASEYRLPDRYARTPPAVGATSVLAHCSADSDFER